ncbi:MAG TPA: acyl CoA--acetate/3-ketoacid CoA transferase subunit alpha, partial [Acidimicrobiales bacterium]
DLYWDDLMLQAAPTGGRFISTERVVPTEDLASQGCLHQLRISRMMVDGVVEAPNGAHFTSCAPDYGRDEEFQRAYAASAASPEAWDAFRAEWLDLSEADYQRKVAAS